MDVVLFFWRNEENIWQVLHEKGGKGIEIRNRHHFSKFVKVNERREGGGRQQNPIAGKKAVGTQELVEDGTLFVVTVPECVHSPDEDLAGVFSSHMSLIYSLEQSVRSTFHFR